MLRVVGLAMLLVACAHDTTGSPGAATNGTARPLPDTTGATAFLEEMTAVARSALTGKPLPEGRLALGSDEDDRPVVIREPEDSVPPSGAILRRLLIFADTGLAFSDGGCLHMTVLIGPTGFRVGGAKFAESCGRRSSPRALAPLQASLASIADALVGRGGAVPWFTVIDAMACVGEEPLCEASIRKPDDAALAELQARVARAGAPVGLSVGELGPIEVADDGRVFYTEVDLDDTTASIRAIKVKQVRAR
jgi:hypothetical protein